MLTKLTGIVIDCIMHSDRHNVLTLYTRTHGRMVFLSPAGAGRMARRRNALLQPLSLIETEVNIRPNREMQNLGPFTPAEIWRDIYFHPVKSALSLFLSEFLNRYLRDSPPDTATWDFIHASISALDRLDRGVANFHIWFLIRFLDYAGISPDLTDLDPALPGINPSLNQGYSGSNPSLSQGYSDMERGDWFDMRTGSAVAYRPMHRDFLTPEETRLLPLLSRITLTNLHCFRFNAAQRRLLLQRLLQYYAIHFPGLSTLRSPAILTEVFS